MKSTRVRTTNLEEEDASRMSKRGRTAASRASPVSVKEDDQQSDPRRRRDENLGQIEAPRFVLKVVQDDVRQGVIVRHALVRDDQTQGGREHAEELGAKPEGNLY
jgi:hypothetical protein